jgi:hypothetical protein
VIAVRKASTLQFQGNPGRHCRLTRTHQPFDNDQATILHIRKSLLRTYRVDLIREYKKAAIKEFLTAAFIIGTQVMFSGYYSTFVRPDSFQRKPYSSSKMRPVIDLPP